MSDPYDEDLTLWIERQAALLRQRAAAGEIANDGLDWLNLAEEAAYALMKA